MYVIFWYSELPAAADPQPTELITTEVYGVMYSTTRTFLGTSYESCMSCDVTAFRCTLRPRCNLGLDAGENYIAPIRTHRDVDVGHGSRRNAVSPPSPARRDNKLCSLQLPLAKQIISPIHGYAPHRMYSIIPPLTSARSSCAPPFLINTYHDACLSIHRSTGDASGLAGVR